MFKDDDRKHWRNVITKGRTVFAALLCVLTLSLSGVPIADGKPINWGHWAPEHLKLLCDNEGGIYVAPTSGGVYACLLPDGTLYVCDSTGACTKDASRSASRGESIQDQLDLAQAKADLIIRKLDRLATQLSAIQDFMVDGLAPKADLLPVSLPAQPGPAGFCRRDNEGRLHVQTINQGEADADATVTRVEFGCGNTGLCSGTTQVDAPTPALLKLGGFADLTFNIPAGCFSPNTNQCNFQIRVDAGNTVAESDETNNNKAGVCGAQFQ